MRAQLTDAEGQIGRWEKRELDSAEMAVAQMGFPRLPISRVAKALLVHELPPEMYETAQRLSDEEFDRLWRSDWP